MNILQKLHNKSFQPTANAADEFKRYTQRVLGTQYLITPYL